MKEYSVFITAPGEQDLHEITQDIVNKYKGTPLAGKTVKKLGDTISGLDKSPFRNVLVNDEKLVTAGVRKIIMDNYIVLYIASEKDKTVSVVRILNLRRNWADLL